MPASVKAILRLLAVCLLGAGQGPAMAFPADLFGYVQEPQQRLADFPQWLRVVERHLADGLQDGECSSRLINRCHLAEWRRFIDRTRGLPVREQLRAVNRYANGKDYVLDLPNYGVEDYWAVPREFLYNGGDCEDYAITKFFSLRWLGLPDEDLRLVIVQDTNLRVPHAVLAVASGAEVFILDNQVQTVMSHRDVVHYAPVFSINESRWWIHVPRAP
ncbi:MAG: transglutaminase-like cysteine peptidase [Gammaproteobacteria bacterium]|jgi:predicted transglutaminase-like cysteine proteinase|nr:transglutaminase-like cysteine peptidase [Gammaproteobacteria bacterium]